MKLLHRSSLYLVLLLVPVLVASGFVLYDLIGTEINEDIDRSLLYQERSIEELFLRSDSTDIASFEDADDDVTFSILKEKPSVKYKFTDYFVGGHGRKRGIPYRKLEAWFEKNGQYVGVEIHQSKLKTEELAEGIVQSLIVMFLMLMLAVVAINRIVSKKLWQPFYQSLSKLNTISFSQKDLPQFSDEKINEFNELNTALNKMTSKMFRDYESQKQFTENASHELQTPLAVIKSKTDLLLQSKAFTEEDMNLIAEIENSVSKLTYLNRSLLLLSKLENRQFDETMVISISELLERVINTFEDRIQLKHIHIAREYKEEAVLKLNPTTAEILFSNLIQNAIRYNFSENGTISIRLNTNEAIISNTGPALKGDPDKLFDRFAKFNTNSESMGLGLAIVKQICEYYNFTIAYSSDHEMHHFTIKFQP